MNTRELYINWENTMKEAGVYTDSRTLNEIIYNGVDIEQADSINLFNKIDSDILMIADEEKVKDFFQNVFSSENLTNYFSGGLGLYVDLTKQGNVQLGRDINVENLTIEEIKIALVELLGEEQPANSITSKKTDEMKRRLINEIRIRLTVHFKPLAEFSAKMYKELEVTMTN